MGASPGGNRRMGPDGAAAESPGLEANVGPGRRSFRDLEVVTDGDGRDLLWVLQRCALLDDAARFGLAGADDDVLVSGRTLHQLPLLEGPGRDDDVVVALQGGLDLCEGLVRDRGPAHGPGLVVVGG